jgi:calcineurin-like phosphoesterase
MKVEVVLHRFITRMPVRYEVQETGPAVFAGVEIEIDPATRRALAITRLEERYPA